MDFCVVLLNRGSSHTPEGFSAPTHLQRTRAGVHKSLLARDNLERSCNISAGQQDRTARTSCEVRAAVPPRGNSDRDAAWRTGWQRNRRRCLTPVPAAMTRGTGPTDSAVQEWKSTDGSRWIAERLG